MDYELKNNNTELHMDAIDRHRWAYYMKMMPKFKTTHAKTRT